MDDWSAYKTRSVCMQFCFASKWGITEITAPKSMRNLSMPMSGGICGRRSSDRIIGWVELLLRWFCCHFPGMRASADLIWKVCKGAGDLHLRTQNGDDSSKVLLVNYKIAAAVRLSPVENCDRSCELDRVLVDSWVWLRDRLFLNWLRTLQFTMDRAYFLSKLA